MTSNRWLLVVAIAVLVIVGASIALGTLAPSEEEFAADTPEGVVQAYLRAVEDEDATAILGLLAPDAASRCNLTDVRNALRYPEDRDLRVTLRETEVSGDRAEVRVNVSERTGSAPFEGGSFDHEETFDLVRAGGEWKIAAVAWPIYCPDFPRGIAPPPPVTTVTPTAASTATPAGQ